MENSLIYSVIVPVYKVESYLRECVESILKQKFDNYEIILVDDGSPDLCPNICDEYEQSNSKIKVIHKTNGGLSDARNAGILNAHGEYLLFCDSDDIWVDENLLNKATNCIRQNNKPDIVLFSGRKYYEETGTVLNDKSIDISFINNSTTYDTLSYLVHSGTYSMSACTKIVRKQFLINNNLFFTKNLLGEDLDWFIGVMLSHPSIKAIDSLNYHYRIRNGSITQTIGEKNIKDFLWILERWIPRLEQSNLKEPLLGIMAYSYMTNLMHLIRLNKAERHQIIKKYKKYEFLLKYGKNRRVKAVYLVKRVVGLRMVGLMLFLYYYFMIRRGGLSGK